MISLRCLILFTTCIVLASSDSSSKSAGDEQLKIDVISKPEGCTNKSKHGDLLTMHYTGTLADGTKFDSR